MEEKLQTLNYRFVWEAELRHLGVDTLASARDKWSLVPKASECMLSNNSPRNRHLAWSVAVGAVDEHSLLPCAIYRTRIRNPPQLNLCLVFGELGLRTLS